MDTSVSMRGNESSNMAGGSIDTADNKRRLNFSMPSWAQESEEHAHTFSGRKSTSEQASCAQRCPMKSISPESRRRSSSLAGVEARDMSRSSAVGVEANEREKREREEARG